MSARAAAAAALLAMLAAPPAAAQAADSLRLYAGAPQLDGRLIRPGRTEYDYVAVQGERRMPLGTVTDEVVLEGRGESATIRRVHTIRSQFGSVVDSSSTRAAGLAPLSSRSRQPHRSIALDFRGTGVKGSVTPVQGAASVIDSAFAHPLFDWSSWDLVLRAAPLREGLVLGQAAYDVDGRGEVWYSGRVMGLERPDGPGGAEAWRVEMEFRATKGTVWIDRATRDLVRFDSVRRDGTVIRQTRQAPSEP